MCILEAVLSVDAAGGVWVLNTINNSALDVLPPGGRVCLSSREGRAVSTWWLPGTWEEGGCPEEVGPTGLELSLRKTGSPWDVVADPGEVPPVHSLGIGGKTTRKSGCLEKLKSVVGVK